MKTTAKSQGLSSTSKTWSIPRVVCANTVMIVGIDMTFESSQIEVPEYRGGARGPRYIVVCIAV